MSEKFIIANNYCREVFDGTHDTPKPSDHGYKLVTSKNIIGNKLDLNSAYLISQEDYLAINKRSKVSQFDVLFSMIGSVGNVYIEQRKNEEIDYSIKNIGVFSSKTEKEAYWLYYYLQSPYAQSFIKKFLNGAVQKFLPLQTLRAFPILSPVENYESIISILKNIDQKIALNNQINEELEAMAKTLYDYWFVQFDFPDENGKPYKTSGGKMVYNNQLKREIPEGWGVENLSNFLTIKNGKDHKDLSDGNYPVYGSGGLMRKVEDYIFEGESVLIPRKGTLNNIMYVDEKFWTVDTMFYTHMKIDYAALYTYFSIKDIDFTKLNTGTGVPSMTASILYQLQILNPNADILKNFDELVRTTYRMIFDNRKQNQDLTQLRDWLLPMLMNGQVKVEE
ncbi:restriction endonuclease subunit S [Streptococcus suis]|nr:restriction endonuclease subunit S [Streptococcus suis]NQP16676.1 restriction endonuclease subunit S [Streptococcus suis]